MNIDTFYVIALNLGASLVLLLLTVKASSLVGGVSSQHELTVKDNPAFGILVAASLIGMAIIITGVLSGDAGESLFDEVASLAIYGLYGITALSVGRVVTDRLVLKRINLQQQVEQGNTAAAIAEAGHIVATSIIIAAGIKWVDDALGLVSLASAVAVFVISQIILLAVSIGRKTVYARRHNGQHLAHAFADNHLALAIRYFGHLTGVALAMSAANYLVVFDPASLMLSLAYWAVVSLVSFVVLWVLATICRHLVLYRVDVVDEVDNQRNLAIASIEASIFIAIGLSIVGLVA